MELEDKKERRRALITKIVFIVAVLALWEILAKAHISELVFPPLETIGAAFIKNFDTGYAGTSLWVYILNSMLLLVEGLAIGIVIAFLFSGLSMISKTVDTIFNLCVSIFDLLPGVALLPVVIVIFGVKPGVIVFLVVHAVLWPMARNVLDG